MTNSLHWTDMLSTNKPTPTVPIQDWYLLWFSMSLCDHQKIVHAIGTYCAQITHRPLSLVTDLLSQIAHHACSCYCSSCFAVRTILQATRADGPRCAMHLPRIRLLTITPLEMIYFPRAILRNTLPCLWNHTQPCLLVFCFLSSGRSPWLGTLDHLRLPLHQQRHPRYKNHVLSMLMHSSKTPIHKFTFLPFTHTPLDDCVPDWISC